MTLGNKIANYRKTKGMTQEALAGLLGVTNQAVSKWESGQSCPDIALLPRIADLFGVTLDELFDRAVSGTAPTSQPEAAPEALPWADDGTLRVVLYVGHKLIGGHSAAKEIHFCYEGPALNIHSELSIYCDTVCGNASAGGDLNCDDVNGSVTAGGDVSCNDVHGSVNAEGSVTCDEVNGNIHAGGSVTCDEVHGSVSAGGNVACDEISDSDIRAGGNVDCDHADCCTFNCGGNAYVDEADCCTIIAGGEVLTDERK